MGYFETISKQVKLDDARRQGESDSEMYKDATLRIILSDLAKFQKLLASLPIGSEDFAYYSALVRGIAAYLSVAVQLTVIPEITEKQR